MRRLFAMICLLAVSVIWIQRYSGSDAAFAIALAQLTPTAPPPAEAPIILPPPTADPAQMSALLYTIQAGDTFLRIAQANNIPVDDMIRANPSIDPNRLRIGQIVIIPLNGLPQIPTALPSTPLPGMSYGIPTQIRGVPLSSLIAIDDGVRQFIRDVYARGQRLGRSPNAFSKVGDSTIENPHFLTRFDDPNYNLGEYEYLQPLIDHFRGSFSRQGNAVRRGLHAWSVFDPMWAGSGCEPGETLMSCEFRQHNPSFLFICLGSNDVGIPREFERSLRQLIEFSASSGVVPILRTKADRIEGSNQNNDIIRRLAAEYRLPLWDYDLVALTIPGKGLGPDNVHMTTFYASDYTLPYALERGVGLHNLTALMALDAVWRVATGEER